MTRLFPLLMLVLLTSLAGCRKPVLDLDRQFDLTQETPSYTFTVDPVKSEQKIKVKVTSEEPVSVAICLQKEAEVVEKEVFARKFSDKTLAKELRTKDAALEATTPANEAVAIIVTREANKATKVRLKASNQ
jgi:hypothetical protein